MNALEITQDELREEIEMLLLDLGDFFGDKAVEDFYYLARKTELNTDYKHIEDIKSLAEIFRSLIVYINRERIIKSHRV